MASLSINVRCPYHSARVAGPATNQRTRGRRLSADASARRARNGTCGIAVSRARSSTSADRASAPRLSTMLELEMLNLDEIATALSDRTDYEHAWLLDPRTGELAFWTS